MAKKAQTYGSINYPDDDDHYSYGGAKRKCANRCLIMFMCFLPVLVSVLLAEIISVNVVNFKKVSDNYLLIPINTLIKLSVDPDKHDAIKFSSVDFDNYNKLKFITRAYENGIAEQGQFVQEGDCGSNTVEKCILLRYWPLGEEYYNGTISCSSEYGKPYLAWEWFDHKTTFDKLRNDFECPPPGSSNVYICSEENDAGPPLHSNDIFDKYGPRNGHYLLAIRFCPGITDNEPDKYYNVTYYIGLEESQPVLVAYKDNDVYTLLGPLMDDDLYIATIPLYGNVDSAVYIYYESASPPQSVANGSEHITIQYELLESAYTETSVKEKVNSAFMVASMIFICAVIFFILYYIVIIL